MADDLPEPLTPPDCDLRDFAFMPLDCMRLRRSKAWLTAKKNPALGFYMVNLWTAAWHEVPAASLEDDDDILADAAMCDLKTWLKVKDQVLRGWVKCSDGRLYHIVVAEKATSSWERKHAQRQRTEAARRAKLQRSSSARTDSVTDVSLHPRDRDSREREGEENNPLTPSRECEGEQNQSSIEGRKGLRANGTNPRAIAAAAEAAKPPPPEPDSPLWPLLRARGMSPAEFRATLGRCSLDDEARRVLAPTAFIAASIRSEHGHALEAEGWRVDAAS